jgi:hypothetical protein
MDKSSRIVSDHEFEAVRQIQGSQIKSESMLKLLDCKEEIIELFNFLEVREKCKIFNMLTAVEHRDVQAKVAAFEDAKVVINGFDDAVKEWKKKEKEKILKKAKA